MAAEISIQALFFGQRGLAIKKLCDERLDIGLSYALVKELQEGESRSGLLKHIKSAWLGLDVFNLLDISNVSGYYWVTDVNKIQYAVPNYLTRRQINVRLSIDF